MKNYDETINSVFERINEYEVKKKYNRKILKRIVVTTCCFLFVALLGIGIWKIDLDKTHLTDDSVIWGEVNRESQEMGLRTWNGKTVTLSLGEVLSDEKNKNSLIAIGVGFEFDNEFIHNGKTIAELKAEADNERLLYSRLWELLKIGDELKYGETLYKTGTPDGIKWAKQLYDETVERIGKDVLAKYIVDGEFLKEKLETDIANYKENKLCREAYDNAVEAYYDFITNKTYEKLKSQNISCEIRNELGGLILYLTVDEFSSLQIDKVMLYSLALKENDVENMTEIQVDDFVITE